MYKPANIAPGVGLEPRSNSSGFILSINDSFKFKITFKNNIIIANHLSFQLYL